LGELSSGGNLTLAEQVLSSFRGKEGGRFLKVEGVSGVRAD